MRWTRRERSSNLEDRRFQTGGRARGVSIGLGGLFILFVLSLLFNQNFFALLGPGTDIDVSPGPGETTAARETSPEEEELVDFMSFVLDDTQSTWSELLAGRYREAQMVLFRDVDRSACGFAQSATGPFYCPGDEKVYLDLSFFDELHRRFGAPGDFAQAYVIAHEIGHHVQTLLGIEAQVRQAQGSRPGQANELSVLMELQADCFAGVWGHSAAQRGVLESGDVEEGLNAAASIGDDRIQQMSGGTVMPESFTHGSSAERVTWFRKGLASGNPEDCDTFSAQ
jgi:predicted metalloprotease